MSVSSRSRPPSRRLLTSWRRAGIISLRDRIVRQFIYGLVLGTAAMYCYARLDIPKMFAYLNSATQSAVESTHGYGGAKK